MCSLPAQSYYVLPHNQNHNQILSRTLRAANSDMSFTDGWQTSSSHLYPSNVSSLMPIDSQEIQSSVYYDTTPSATNLNGDN
ncbi:unnamed protein product, partial [Oppiella nova]